MLILLSLFAGAAEGADPVRVTLGFEDAARHLVTVTASYPASADGHDLRMASWTPGSYKIRDYAKHVEGLSATAAGEPVGVDKVAKNHWHIDHTGPVTVTYRVYAREMGVQTSFVDDQLAILSGASLFLFDAADQGPWELTLEPPSGWTSHTGLDAAAEPHHYTAADVDELLDSPLLVGPATAVDFAVADRPHQLVSLGFDTTWDDARAAADLGKLVQAHVDFWGEAPYARYVFLNAGTDGGGGLEHLDSTLMITARDAMATEDRYRGWLGLASHEFFHTWNIKRLRPVEYGPFDYDREVHSTSLWVAEGLTSYYGGLLLHRAGLQDTDAWLAELARMIDGLQSTPGRAVRSVEEASFDAWIKHYQRDENTRNSSVSYYTKGAVIGFLLDAEIRRLTDGERSLDDAMRLAYSRYAGDVGYTPDQLRAVLVEVGGEALGPWLDHALSTTEELDYEPALAYYGLTFGPEPEEVSAWLGLGQTAGRVTVVTRDSPAWAAGLAVDDEILAIDGYRLTDLGTQLDRYAPGDTVELLVARRGRIHTRAVTLGAKPRSYELKSVAKPTRAQKKARAAWLGHE